MKKRLIGVLIIVALVGVMFVAKTEAFLGIGDVVFDPSVYEQSVQQVFQLAKQYEQLVQSYDMLRLQYAQLLWNAQRIPVDMTTRYRSITTAWNHIEPTNTYGTTAAWIQAITTGRSVTDNYTASTEPLLEYGNALSNVPVDQRARVQANYGAVELTDGATESAIDLIGRLRANAPAVQSAIQGVELDSLSGSPEMNTEVAVLNKINASGLIAIHSAQDTNQLLITLAEQQSLNAKRVRDAEARSINQHIRFVSEGQAALKAQSVGASDAMLAFRMP